MSVSICPDGARGVPELRKRRNKNTDTRKQNHGHAEIENGKRNVNFHGRKQKQHRATIFVLGPKFPRDGLPGTSCRGILRRFLDLARSLNRLSQQKNPNSIFQAHAFLNQEDCSVLYSRCSYVLANVLWSSIEKPEKWSRRSICTRHVTPVGSIKVQQRSLDVY